MLDEFNIPCEILIIETGYTNRLNDMLDVVHDFCKARKIKPLFIYHHDIYPLKIEGNTVVPDNDDKYSKWCMGIVDKLRDNNLLVYGNIAFQIDYVNKAHKIYNNLIELDYCEPYGEPKIKFLGKDDKLYIMYVKISAESD